MFFGFIVSSRETLGSRINHLVDIFFDYGGGWWYSLGYLRNWQVKKFFLIEQKKFCLIKKFFLTCLSDDRLPKIKKEHDDISDLRLENLKSKLE